MVRAGAVASSFAVPLSAIFSHRANASDYGMLQDDPGGTGMKLAAGFTGHILQTTRETLTDGASVPGLPDGMACFEGPNRTWILMRNHELGSGAGGVTRLVIDRETLDVQASNWVLTGTSRNCAGGPSPWGWLSCEEVDTGQVFVCPTDAETGSNRDPIRGYGRFNHEAVAIHPETLQAYLTEDDANSCLYRFVPTDAATDPFAGQLQALKVVGSSGFDTDDMNLGDQVDVEWVDIDDPSGGTARQGFDRGAARFVRGEGIWEHEGAVFVVSTSGGPGSNGQVFRLIDGPASATLEVIADASAGDLDMPDNITVSPWGQVFLAEDGGGTNFLRALTDSGEIVPFASNDESEFAGVCFSPDGSTLFVNIQGAGLTIAVTGPFPEVPDDGTTSDSGDSDDSSAGSSESDGSDGPGSASGDGSDSNDASGSSEGETGGGTGTSGGSAGTASSAGDATEGTLSGAADDGAPAEDGCACTSDGGSGAASGVLAPLLAAALGRRERKSNDSDPNH